MGRADELIENGFQSFPSKNRCIFAHAKDLQKSKIIRPLNYKSLHKNGREGMRLQ